MDGKPDHPAGHGALYLQSVAAAWTAACTVKYSGAGLQLPANPHVRTCGNGALQHLFRNPSGHGGQPDAPSCHDRRVRCEYYPGPYLCSGIPLGCGRCCNGNCAGPGLLRHHLLSAAEKIRYLEHRENRLEMGLGYGKAPAGPWDSRGVPECDHWFRRYCHPVCHQWIWPSVCGRLYGYQQVVRTSGAGSSLLRLCHILLCGAESGRGGIRQDQGRCARLSPNIHRHRGGHRSGPPSFRAQHSENIYLLRGIQCIRGTDHCI